MGREDVGEELADMAIYLLGLAEMASIDLQATIAVHGGKL
jgi:NTP pyrophosphatase (non-canonical NTP hydrolase)